MNVPELMKIFSEWGWGVMFWPCCCCHSPFYPWLRRYLEIKVRRDASFLHALNLCFWLLFMKFKLSRESEQETATEYLWVIFSSINSILWWKFIYSSWQCCKFALRSNVCRCSSGFSGNFRGGIIPAGYRWVHLREGVQIITSVFTRYYEKYITVWER